MAWIRSQDQTFITIIQTIAYYPCSRLDTSGQYTAHELRVYSEYFMDDIGRVVGDFPTKEAALAELDCIERWISTGTNDVYQVAKP